MHWSVCSRLYSWSMAASGGGGFNFLSRRHGVKVDSDVSIEECSLAVGEIVGCENIMSASRMNKAIVVFVKTIELANQLVDSGIVINGMFTSVLPLSTPAKKVTLSNVPPFIANEVLAKMLSRYGRLVSQIKMIPIGCKSPQLKHVISFRRYVYMILQDNLDDLDLSLNFRHDDYNYVIFATTNSMKCFGCGEMGHLIRACPVRADAPGERQANTVDAEIPGPSRVQVATVARVAPTENSPEGESSAVNEAEIQGAVSENVESADQLNDAQNSSDAAEVVEQLITSIEENQVSVTGLKEAVFKTPQKRRLKQRRTEKQAKMMDECDWSPTDTESESDVSECSVACSLPASGFSNQIYNVDDIKSFLKETKNARKVRIEEFFPDVVQFIEKAKLFKSEGSFTNQEVYRLKKILSKLNAQSGHNVNHT